MKKKIFMLLALVMTVMTASAEAGYGLKVVKSEHGTVAFKVNGTSVTSAAEGSAVTMTIAPDGGYVVTEVTNQLTAGWEMANAPRRTDMGITTSVEMKKAAENVYTFTMPAANVEVSIVYDIKIPTQADETKDETKKVADVQLNMTAVEGEAPTVDPTTGNTIIPVVIESIEVPATAPQEIVVEVAAQTQVGNNVFVVREIKANAFKTDASKVKVTKVIMPETEEAIPVEAGAMSPNGTAIEVETPLYLLDDYALMLSMKPNYEGKLVSAKAQAPERFWTFSSGVDVAVPEGVTVYRAFTENGTIRILPIDKANADRIILANNGVLLSCNSLKGGDIYTFIANPGNQPSGTVPATTDACSYEGNSMVPTIVDTNYPTGRYYILKNNEFHTMSANGKVPACKAVFDTNKQ